MIASMPLAAANRASSGAKIPLSTSLVRTVSRRRLMNSQVKFGVLKIGFAGQIARRRMAAAAFARVDAPKPDERFPLLWAEHINSEDDCLASRAFRPLGQAVADRPSLRRIELEPDRCAAGSNRILHRRRCDRG